MPATNINRSRDGTARDDFVLASALLRGEAVPDQGHPCERVRVVNLTRCRRGALNYSDACTDVHLISICEGEQ